MTNIRDEASPQKSFVELLDPNFIAKHLTENRVENTRLGTTASSEPNPKRNATLVQLILFRLVDLQTYSGLS